MEIIAWAVLRLAFAWMFLYPIKDLLADWGSTKKVVGLLTPVFPGLCAVIMLLVMLGGSLSILLGYYAQIGGLVLCLYSIFGIKVHYKLSQQAKAGHLSSQVSDCDREVLAEAQALAVVGHITSAEKNVVLAAVGFMFTLLGSGAFSLTDNIF